MNSPDFQEREAKFRTEIIQLSKKYQIDIVPTLKQTAFNQVTALLSFVDVKEESKTKVDVTTN